MRERRERRERIERRERREERILLCKPKMCGREMDFIKPALAEDWAVPMGPDVTAFEKELGVSTIIG